MDTLAKRLRPIILKEGRRELTSGGVSNHYFEFNDLCGYPGLFNEVVDGLVGKIDRRTNLLVGYGFGGAPLVSVAGTLNDIRFCSIRDEDKQHGMENRFEGVSPRSGDLVTIVDDVLTTGGTLEKARKIVEETDAKILGYTVVINRAKEYPSSLNPLAWLFTEKDFVSTVD